MRPLQARIDTTAIAHNLRHIRRFSANAPVVAVIKADAYGHGAANVLPALEDADWLGVASIDEALSLRRLGANHPILLLEGVFSPEEYAIGFSFNFEFVIHSQTQIEMLEAAELYRPIRVWLKIDTGMGRLGFAPEAMFAMHQRIQASGKSASPIRLMSHLASADDPSDTMTDRQIDRFHAIAESLGVATSLAESPLSLANSAGILIHPRARIGALRPGLVLYGVAPDAASTGAGHGLRPAMRLATQLIALRQVGAGDTVGYGGTWQAKRDSMIATAAIGYGDGLPRSLAPAGQVMVEGRKAPLAGRISMDMIGIDVSDIPAARIGSEVVIWGPELPVEHQALAAGTIPYELLAGITARVPRIAVGSF